MSFKRYLYFIFLNKIPCRNRNGGFINAVKGIILKKILRHVGNNVNIRPNIKFAIGSNISIGDNSGIGDRCFLQDIGSINIGADVLMAPEVMIYTSNHEMRKDELIRKQGIKISEVIIEDDVWIGARAIILPGVRISKGAVVAAGAVVAKDVAPFSIVGGVPAKVLGFRQ